VARAAVKAARIWGFMMFPEGYSDHVYTRASSGNIVDNDTLEGSQIYLEMDYSSKLKYQASLLRRIYRKRK
jgi:hypothetical protein